MFRTAAPVLFAWFLILPTPLLAAERDAKSPVINPADAGVARDGSRAVPPFEFGRPTRPAILPSLYVSFAALQAADGCLTMSGLARGASEANPLLRGAVGNAAVFWAVKSGATLTSIYVAERLWRRNHRVEAIAVMIVSNGILAGVAVHNARVLRAR
jgi:hypothetical protein